MKENTKEHLDVPAAYLEKAKGKAFHCRGVNRNSPYELFAGEYVNSRLLLKAG